MVYPDLLIRKDIFSQRVFLSQNNLRSIWRSLTFLTILEQREVRSITVQRTKKYPREKLCCISRKLLIWYGVRQYQGEFAKHHDNTIKDNVTVTSSNFRRNDGTMRILTHLWPKTIISYQ